MVTLLLVLETADLIWVWILLLLLNQVDKRGRTASLAALVPRSFLQDCLLQLDLLGTIRWLYLMLLCIWDLASHGRDTLTCTVSGLLMSFKQNFWLLRYLSRCLWTTFRSDTQRTSVYHCVVVYLLRNLSQALLTQDLLWWSCLLRFLLGKVRIPRLLGRGKLLHLRRLLSGWSRSWGISCAALCNLRLWVENLTQNLLIVIAEQVNVWVPIATSMPIWWATVLLFHFFDNLTANLANASNC